MLSGTDIALRRGGRAVLAGLSFRAEPGRALIVRGPNGAGKSTLLRALAGMLPLTGGTVRLGDVDLSDRAAFSECVAYAGHLDAVKPALTVAENLAVWAGLFGAAAGRAAAALDRFGLGALGQRPAAQCSAGQRRRLGLARLLVVDRPLWLLDEPTVSLDAASAATVADLIRTHCAGGGIALIATHVDLGLDDAEVLELGPYRAARAPAGGATEDDAFLAGDWR